MLSVSSFTDTSELVPVAAGAGSFFVLSAMYAENFSTWSTQANGMLQNNIWTALSQANIGANLQHYNPLIDDKIKELFSIPDTWKLTAQMPFGSIESQPNEKYIEDISTRLKIY